MKRFFFKGFASVTLSNHKMKRIRIPRLLTSVFTICLSLVYSACCAEENSSTGNYEIHEWGVLKGCESSEESKIYHLSNAPQPSELVPAKEPIIYVHSKDKKPFSISVRFHSGMPTVIYPQGEIKDKVISWNNVDFAKDLSLSKRMPIYQDEGQAKTDESLQRLFPILSDVDSDLLLYKGVSSRFLFYEGKLPFTHNVMITFNSQNKQFTVKNNNAFSVFDIFVVRRLGEEEPARKAVMDRRRTLAKKMAIAKVDSLEAFQEVVLSFNSTDNLEFTPYLTKLGFTEKEALAFNNTWKSSFLGSQNIIYRLPDEQYNKMISLECNPIAKKVIRSLYVCGPFNL
jgi:hypothetical protein